MSPLTPQQMSQINRECQGMTTTDFKIWWCEKEGVSFTFIDLYPEYKSAYDYFLNLNKR